MFPCTYRLPDGACCNEPAYALDWSSGNPFAFLCACHFELVVVRPNLQRPSSPVIEKGFGEACNRVQEQLGWPRCGVGGCMKFAATIFPEPLCDRHSQERLKDWANQMRKFFLSR